MNKAESKSPVLESVVFEQMISDIFASIREVEREVQDCLAEIFGLSIDKQDCGLISEKLSPAIEEILASYLGVPPKLS